MSQLVQITDKGKLQLHFHPGQWKAWESEKRIVLALAGTQSGKTVMGPPWLYREIQRRGPGDYMVVAPTYPLLDKKVLPETLGLFNQLGLGRYRDKRKVFTFSAAGQERTHGRPSGTPTQVFFGHATDPESLESATAKAAWLDEAGQKRFRLDSYEAIKRRLSIHQGRILITTTPYDLGWLKTKIHDPWIESGQNHPDIDVINFRSCDNPAFPREEFEKARRELPWWKFALFYLAIFTRPAGQIYDCFEEKRLVVEPFPIPVSWLRFCGLDFGGVNTAAVMIAQHPTTGQLYLYREYHAGGRTATEHAVAILEGEPGYQVCVGGSKSEGQWRREFALGGMPVIEPPISDVEVGIQRVYGVLATGGLAIFKSCERTIDQLQSYSRACDATGQPTEKIEDKEIYHYADALRYIMSWLRRNEAIGWKPTYNEKARSEMDRMPGDIWSFEDDKTIWGKQW